MLPFIGRLLFLTSTSKTSTGKDVDHCVDNGAKSGVATSDMGTKNSTDVGASENEVIDVGAAKSEVVPLVTSPSTKTAATSLTPHQAPPKVGSIIRN